LEDRKLSYSGEEGGVNWGGLRPYAITALWKKTKDELIVFQLDRREKRYSWKGGGEQAEKKRKKTGPQT